MTSTQRITIAARVSRCLAATALMAGLAVETAAVAGAEREWDIGQHDKCIEDMVAGRDLTLEEYDAVWQYCCISSGGEWNDGRKACEAPPEAENVPGTPAASTTPPVLENPTGQPSNPMIPTPRGPNSGTLAP